MSIILNPDDREIYFPSVPSDAVSEGLLQQAQSLAESHDGANRRLGIEDYFQSFQSTNNQASFQLSYYPIVPDSVMVAVKTIGLLVSSNLESGSWTIDRTNRLFLQGSRIGTEIQVSYQAGYDPASPIAEEVKYALGRIVEFLHSRQGQAIQSGVLEFSVAGEYSIKYGGAEYASGLPKQLLDSFRKYRPHRSFNG